MCQQSGGERQPSYRVHNQRYGCNDLLQDLGLASGEWRAVRRANTQSSLSHTSTSQLHTAVHRRGSRARARAPPSVSFSMPPLSRSAARSHRRAPDPNAMPRPGARAAHRTGHRAPLSHAHTDTYAAHFVPALLAAQRCAPSAAPPSSAPHLSPLATPESHASHTPLAARSMPVSHPPWPPRVTRCGRFALRSRRRPRHGARRRAPGCSCCRP